MKWRMFLPFLLLFLGLPSFAAYQQQGFSEFQEDVGGVRFVCDNQCFLLVGSLEWDYISLRWRITGSGMMGYGFLVGQQIVPGEIFQVSDSALLDKQFVFRDLSFFSQIPKDAQLVLLAQGQVMWNDLLFSFGAYSFFNEILQWWKDFWEMETLTPYSINLRYWVKILWVSIVKYGYWIFILVGLYILLFVKWGKERKVRKIFFLWIGVFLFLGIRNLITYMWIVDQGLKKYTYMPYEQKTYFDLGDYIVFTDKIRKTLGLDERKKSCKIYVDSFQDWPFKWHRNTVYLRPCYLVLTWSESDYIIYYKKSIVSWDLWKPVLVDFNWSYLLHNK